jgi:hypothetical protein
LQIGVEWKRLECEQIDGTQHCGFCDAYHQTFSRIVNLFEEFDHFRHLDRIGKIFITNVREVGDENVLLQYRKFQELRR